MKPCTIQIVLCIGITHGWWVYKLDVYNDFLNVFLDIDMFMN
jgi:hypothetical protein